MRRTEEEELESGWSFTVLRLDRLLQQGIVRKRFLTVDALSGPFGGGGPHVSQGVGRMTLLAKMDKIDKHKYNNSCRAFPKCQTLLCYCASQSNRSC